MEKFHIDENLEELEPGVYEDTVFFNCVFRNLRGVTFRNCIMNQSKVITENIREVQGLTVTLDCRTFENVELSETVFDLMLLMLVKGKGNTEKRKKLIEVLGGKKRVAEMLSLLSELERPE